MSPINFSEDEVTRMHDEAEKYLVQRWEHRPGYKPLILTHGDGGHFWDAKGKKYLDFMSQLYNAHIGLNNREVIEAAKKQLDEMAYASPSYSNVPQIQLAKKLAQITPGDLCKTFFGNSGTEANEVAIKIAQLYRGASKVISYWDAYHGSTYAMVSVGGSSRNRQFPGLSIFEEFKHVPSPYCYRCFFKKEYPECDLLCAEFVRYTIEKEGEKSVAAFIAEPICSWAGQVVPPDGYWKKIREICNETGVLMIFDEVMTGFARTGKMFACEHWNIVPDIETYAKGITSGYVPLGATIMNKKIGDHFDEKGFPHGYTYSGHALACATSLAVINIYYKEDLTNRAAKMGEYMMDELRGMMDRQPVIGDIRGLGLFMGVELVANRETKEEFQPKNLTPEQKKDPAHNPMVYLSDRAKEKGLIIGSAPGTGIIRLMPYLLITQEQVDKGLKLLEETIAETTNKFGYPKARK
ncbi:MAG: aspartate aminotransferase family protein [Candidatus Bathyarchaeota archaeon]|nr:aspartate aminotransferase family protein [Candidatus Bathyarchaeota archaeon]